MTMKATVTSMSKWSSCAMSSDVALVESQRARVAAARRLVIKFGSAVLSDDNGGLALERLVPWCEHISALRAAGREVIVVSSGAVAAGLATLGWRERPTALGALQAAASVGQAAIVRAWESELSRHGVVAGMVLLTRDDLANRRRYLNARATLTTLLDAGVVPIINENDSVATEEIRFGDNDTLAARVCSLLAADALILVTDQAGLMTADPRHDPNASLLPYADADDPALDAMVGTGKGHLGRGGMVSKLRSARIAARSGAQTLIVSGFEPSALAAASAGETVGTLLGTEVQPLDARKRWIADQLEVSGEVSLDDGAVSALLERGVSLLPVGVTAVTGAFSRGDVVRLLDPQGRAIAQGLVNYDHRDASALIGQATSRIEAVLGYAYEAELVHRDNLVRL